MLRIIPVACLLSIGFVGLAHAQQAPAAPGQTSPGDKRAESSLPPNGVIRPAPDASRDSTVKPPDVDPGMAISPPGTPGGNPKVVPK